LPEAMSSSSGDQDAIGCGQVVRYREATNPQTDQERIPLR
jgi:hypothetical protein